MTTFILMNTGPWDKYLRYGVASHEATVKFDAAPIICVFYKTLLRVPEKAGPNECCALIKILF